MNNRIMADPEGLIQMATKIYDLFEQYDKVREEITNISDSISESWNDETCKTFVNSIHSYDPEFKKLGLVIQQISDILKRHGIRLQNSRDSLTGMAGRL